MFFNKIKVSTKGEKMKSGSKRRAALALALSVGMCLSAMYCNVFSFAADNNGDDGIDAMQTISSTDEANTKTESNDESEDSKEATVEKQATKKEVAKGNRAVQDGVITNIEALLQDGSGPVGNITQWQVFRIKADFALNDSVKSGDTTTIKLPEKLRFNQTVPFEIKTENGDVVANAVVNGADKTITLTYTDFAENHSDVTGDFFFYVRMDRSKVEDAEDIPLDFVVNNQVISAGSVHFVGYPTPSGAIVAKSGTQESTANGTRAFFNVNINTQHTDLKDVTVVDTLKTDGIKINKDTFVIKKGNWVAVKGDWQLQNLTVVTDQYDVEWNGDVGFTVSLGDVSSSEGYQITYYVTSDYELIDGENVDNNVILHSSNNEDKSFDARITWTVAGGSAVGYSYEIKIHKESEDGSALSGAVFNVVRTANNSVVGTITTGSDGNGSLSGLLKTDYSLVEVTAPEGFLPLEDPVTVSANEFGSDKTVLKTITNKVATTEISGKKTWDDNNNQDGVRPDSITIRLLADGVEKENKTVTEANDWSWAFQNLPIYDLSDGHEIVYSLTEDAVTDYSTEYNSYDVTNIHAPGKTSVTVSKAWDDNNDQDGIRPASVTIKLLADGKETGDSLELNNANNWTASFTNLDAYKNGKRIDYTISEAGVSGYTVQITGDASQGYVVTNTHTPEKQDSVVSSSDGKPKTGDAINLYGCIGALLISALAIACLLRRKPRKQ